MERGGARPSHHTSSAAGPNERKQAVRGTGAIKAYEDLNVEADREGGFLESWFCRRGDGSRWQRQSRFRPPHAGVCEDDFDREREALQPPLLCGRAG